MRKFINVPYGVFIPLFYILFFHPIVYGQNLIVPDFVATYDFRCIEDTITKEYFKPSPFLLIAKGANSRFHLLNAQFNDSIVTAYSAANPRVPSSEGEARSLNSSRQFMTYFRNIKKPQTMNLWAEKNFRENLTEASLLWRIPSYHLEVIYPLPWKLDPAAVDTINGVTCRMANLEYGGRTWTAYYNTDIAIPQGPYVFSGLPGLIVRIEDDRGWYRFDLSAFTAKPKGEYFWRSRYYNSGSQKLERNAYVDRVAKERKTPDTGPVPTTEAQLLEMKQRLSKQHWLLLEQR